ncbi:hypothetical protein GNP61_02940 [Aliivibrio fischeri]|uniref:hypothetical protein n=1 Tax=Aliivibrio fischeri TaxID=668 RepID=UPI0012DA3444|nr:hypothetical protein [Aliivibrio fischeri]MUK40503.1 hypothetical protein [Aliivibrio fischeri]
MRPSLYMLQKELIEHKTVSRVPLFILLCGVVLFLSLMMNTNLQDNLFISVQTQGDFTPFSTEFSNDVQIMLSFMVGILSLALSTTYLSKTLRKERNEGSSAFWRSMPVTSQHTHAIKLAFGLIVIPLIFSILVLIANLCLWFISLSSDSVLVLLHEHSSLLYVITSWFQFLTRMLLVSVVMLPIAGLILAVSQVSNSPLIVLFLGGYALKILSNWVLGWDGISQFLSHIYQIPTTVLLSHNPLVSFEHAGIGFLSLYALLGALALFVSISLYRTTEISWQSLNPSWLIKK